MSWHGAIRKAVFAKLTEATAPVWPVYSSPPANMALPVIVIGQIVLVEMVDKASRDGFFEFGVDSAIQGNSPAALDEMSDWVTARLHMAGLTSATAQLLPPQLVNETDSADREAPGGPLMVRSQTFRLFAGSL